MHTHKNITERKYRRDKVFLLRIILHIGN